MSLCLNSNPYLLSTFLLDAYSGLKNYLFLISSNSLHVVMCSIYPSTDFTLLKYLCENFHHVESLNVSSKSKFQLTCYTPCSCKLWWGFFTNFSQFPPSLLSPRYTFTTNLNASQAAFSFLWRTTSNSSSLRSS